MEGGAVRGPVLVLLLAALVLVPSAAAQPWELCGSTSGNYSNGSAYEVNLFQLITELRANASSSPSLFASGSVGAGANAVYGVLICGGDISASYCFDCGTSAGRDVQRMCNRTRDAALCYNQCYVRVSGTDFLASANNSGELGLISGTNVSAGVDVAAYDRAVTALLNATARYAVENSTRLFATGQLVGLDPKIPNIWSMAQCAADLSPAQCRRCLDDLLAQWFNGTSGFDPNGDGARIAGSRCTLRSELGEKFYTGSPMVKLQRNGQPASPAPALPPSTDVSPGTVKGKHISVGKLLGIMLPVVFVAAVVSITLCMWNVRKKRRYQRSKLAHRTHTVEDFESIKSTLLSLSSLQVATNNFNESNKLGEGGFGAVYKVWRHWSEGTIEEIIDDSLGRNYSEAEVLKCINIGLMCLQQNPVDRPTMSEITLMLDDDATSSLPPVARPTFFWDGSSGYSGSTVSVSHPSAR
ncbi:hypothetical protein EJB05_12084, partial [Eragrostis curvula]